MQKNDSLVIVTPRMIRDTLVFKGPVTLTDLMKALRISDPNLRSEIFRSLIILQDLGEADCDACTGLWASNIQLR